MIHDVVVKPLRRLVDDRGYLMEILRNDDPLFQEFGQLYISACFPDMVKAWHQHHIQTDFFCCVQGNIKVGLYDDREDSPSRGEVQSVVIGVLNPALIIIPPFLWHGMSAVGGETAVLINMPTELYNYNEPDEYRRDPFDPDIPFEWFTQGG